jgi:hypothetical protein
LWLLTILYFGGGSFLYNMALEGFIFESLVPCR